MRNVKFTFSQSLGSVFFTMLLAVTLSGQTIGLQVDPVHRVLFGQDTVSAGTRLIWFPEKAAIRAGEVFNNFSAQHLYWNSNNVGMHSVAFGENTLASGEKSMAWGANNRAESDNATVWGQTNRATSNLSTAWGNANLASGSYSTVWGQQTTASSLLTTAWGSGNEASGESSTVWGIGNSSKSKVETVFGQYADTSSTANPFNVDPEDQLLAIGNGTSTTDRNNAFTVLKSGEAYFHSPGDQDSSLYIGFRDGPKYGMNGNKDLNVSGVLGDPEEDKGFVIESNHQESNFESSGIYMDGDQVIIWSPGDNNRLFSVYDEDDGGVERWYVDGDGDDFKASDKRFKKNIRSLESPLSDLMKINGKKYQWKDIALEKSKSIAKNQQDSYKYGVIAQEVEQVFPELVQTNKDGYMFVDYKGFIPILIEVCKKQQTEIEEMRALLIEQKELISSIINNINSGSSSDE